MRRDQLEHAIRASTEIIRQETVIVIGSQSILGTWGEDELPDLTTRSPEVDISPLSDDDAESLADELDSIAGEWSPFHETHGFYIQGVGRHTAVLPEGWTSRLVAVSNDNTRGRTGLCLDPYDLCVAKLIANRDKDRLFVRALIDAELIEPGLLSERIGMLREESERAAIAIRWVAGVAEALTGKPKPPPTASAGGGTGQKRHLRGRPEGGRFAPQQHGESAVTLGD